MILQRVCSTGASAGDRPGHWWHQISQAAHGRPAPGVPRMARCVLRADPTSPGTGRDFTRGTLTDWRLDGLLDSTEMAVSELVTNALRHGLGDTNAPHPVQLVLLRTVQRLVTVVTDPSTLPPSRGEPGDFAESGRGLWIVESISLCWGWTPLEDGGKAVWAAFEIPA
jgi:hypothetical protein